MYISFHLCDIIHAQSLNFQVMLYKLWRKRKRKKEKLNLSLFGSHVVGKFMAQVSLKTKFTYRYAYMHIIWTMNYEALLEEARWDQTIFLMFFPFSFMCMGALVYKKWGFIPIQWWVKVRTSNHGVKDRNSVECKGRGSNGYSTFQSTMLRDVASIVCRERGSRRQLLIENICSD